MRITLDKEDFIYDLIVLGENLVKVQLCRRAKQKGFPQWGVPWKSTEGWEGVWPIGSVELTELLTPAFSNISMVDCLLATQCPFDFLSTAIDKTQNTVHAKQAFYH